MFTAEHFFNLLTFELVDQDSTSHDAQRDITNAVYEWR